MQNSRSILFVAHSILQMSCRYLMYREKTVWFVESTFQFDQVLRRLKVGGNPENENYEEFYGHFV